MSSTITPTFTAPPSDSPSPTNGGNSGGGSSMQRGANYFFGFLITFVVLLLLFIGCGIGSRRRFARRRALFLATLDPQCMPKEMLPPRPSFFETPFVASDGKSSWDNLNPLSVRMVRKQTEEPRSGDQSTPSEFNVPPPEGQTSPSSSMFPSWLRRPRHADETQASNESEVEPEPPESIQVAAIIGMPTLSHKDDNYHDERLPEYQIGVVNLPWREGMPS